MWSVNETKSIKKTISYNDLNTIQMCVYEWMAWMSKRQRPTPHSNSFPIDSCFSTDDRVADKSVDFVVTGADRTTMMMSLFILARFA